MPLHPAIVHLPLGLAFVAPALALALAIAIWRDLLPARAFAVVAGLQLVALLAGFAAYVSGGEDQRLVEKVVAERFLEHHEEAGELFLWGQGVALALSAMVLGAKGLGAKVAPALATAAALAVAGLAFRVGHAGGELVYRHGAASAFQAPAATGPLKASDH